MGRSVEQWRVAAPTGPAFRPRECHRQGDNGTPVGVAASYALPQPVLAERVKLTARQAPPGPRKWGTPCSSTAEAYEIPVRLRAGGRRRAGTKPPQGAARWKGEADQPRIWAWMRQEGNPSPWGLRGGRVGAGERQHQAVRSVTGLHTHKAWVWRIGLRRDADRGPKDRHRGTCTATPAQTPVSSTGEVDQKGHPFQRVPLHYEPTRLNSHSLSAYA